MDKPSARPYKARLSSPGRLFVISWSEPAPATSFASAEQSGVVQLGPRRAVQFTRLLPELPLGAIDRCASERLRRSSPLHLSNI